MRRASIPLPIPCEGITLPFELHTHLFVLLLQDRCRMEMTVSVDKSRRRMMGWMTRRSSAVYDSIEWVGWSQCGFLKLNEYCCATVGNLYVRIYESNNE